ncbi:S-adenosyl-l-methionine hydroxide adenosyltransferase family protein [Methylosinus sp. H3A]|uniref:SAM hydrolase/SAM-dependent halogenase family protein n=1 Tax=Methylosinus sp. H3A TaxID=2785786 RepID=UPI0018C28B65|nr:S-adenosyl-l-methionine hydroxide adenosyltransferase family protein [Methylosinus sp. H3A]MBG0808230.1 S-adenosyl-l-methionine hydroxide adenosyltransferase family protein [Methylosinus sp. H3A]
MFRSIVVALALGLSCGGAAARSPLVLFTDFGTADGAVAAMKGVAYSISQDLLIADLSHEDPGGIFAGGFRLYQAEQFWPKGSVFVAVVDPGVGTGRLAIALETLSGRFFLAPNNGLLTLVAQREGVKELREIDESVNRRPGSEQSHTFHGRDIFAYAGARLASGAQSFEQIGRKLPPEALIALPYRAAERKGDLVNGVIPVLDAHFGNVWTNIPQSMFEELKVALGDDLRVRIHHGDRLVVDLVAPYQRTFGDVQPGTPLVYVDSLFDMAVALNLANFAERYGVGFGPDWTIDFSRAP